MKDSVLELVKNVDWVNACFICFAAFIGAYFGYRYNLKIEKKKANRQMRADFCTLSTQMYLNLSTMLLYKKAYLDKIKKAYDAKNLIFIYTNLKIPNTSFVFDINKYVFLNDCNQCFLSELDTIKNINDQFHQLWCMYEKQLHDFNLTEVKKNPKLLEDLKKSFEGLLAFYNQFCLRLYILDEKLSICYKRFFNVNFYNDEDLKSNIDITKYIPDAFDDEEFVTIRKQFDAHWKPERSLWGDFRFIGRKLKYKIVHLVIYLGLKHNTGRIKKGKQNGK